MATRKRRQKPKYSKVIVAICVLMTTAFTVFVLWSCAAQQRPVPDSLIYCVFGMYGIEFASLAAIKCSDNKHAAKGDAAARAMPKVNIDEG